MRFEWLILNIPRGSRNDMVQEYKMSEMAVLGAVRISPIASGR
jgi:hypothetical protein